MAHREAERAVARGVRDLGLPMVYSNQASVAMEEVTEILGDAPDPTAPADAPEGTSCMVTEHGARSAGEDGGEPTTVSGEQPRPNDGVDAAVHRAEPTLSDPMRNGARTNGKL